MLGNEFPSTDFLCENFNNFLFDLTSHFSPLQPPDDGATITVPEEFLVSAHQAFCALRSIKVKKSPGPDKILNRIWKEFAFELAPVVRDLYNSSLVEGVVSCAWKQSIVVPVPKVNPPKVLEEDLRPTSLTALLAKIMEGFTHESLARQVLGQLDIKQFCV